MRVMIALAATALAFALIASPLLASAASPHFIGTPTIRKNSNGSVTADFKAAGLANVVTGAFLTSSGGTALLQCVNPDGNNPPPKQLSFTRLHGQTIFIQPRNGQITASASVGPPPLPTPAQICPNALWSVTIISITYHNVVLHVQQNNIDILAFNFGNVDPGIAVATAAVVSRQ